MELQTDTQKIIGKEVAGTTMTGVEIVGNLAQGILDRLTVVDAAKEQGTHALVKTLVPHGLR